MRWRDRDSHEAGLCLGVRVSIRFKDTASRDNPEGGMIAASESLVEPTMGASIRHRLVFGRRREERRDRDRADLDSQLGGVEASAGSGPILGRQLEIALARPVRQHAEEIAQIRFRVKPMQSCRRDQREDVAGALAVRIAADEEPALSSDRIRLISRSDRLFSRINRPSSSTRMSASF